MTRRIIIDSNVILSALRSKKGASHRLLQLIDAGKFEFAISVPIILEYEDVIKRQLDALVFSEEEINAILGYICSIGIQTEIYFLWRPSSKDEGDAKIIEAAVAAGCDTIVTFNSRNFLEARSFGIAVIPPKEFLLEIGVVL